jgi:hypothetical protein
MNVWNSQPAGICKQVLAGAKFYPLHGSAKVTLGELGRVQMVGIKPSGVPLTEGEFSNSTDG